MRIPCLLTGWGCGVCFITVARNFWPNALETTQKDPYPQQFVSGIPLISGGFLGCLGGGMFQGVLDVFRWSERGLKDTEFYFPKKTEWLDRSPLFQWPQQEVILSCRQKNKRPFHLCIYAPFLQVVQLGRWVSCSVVDMGSMFLGG